MRGDLFLVDSSVWLEALPARTAGQEIRDRVDTLLAEDRVATTGMIQLELLGGARTEAEYRRLAELFSALHQLPASAETWAGAARLGFQLRRQGLPLPFTDLLIAAVAIAAEAVLLHRDRHFDLIAGRSTLRVESHLAAAS